MTFTNPLYEPIQVKLLPQRVPPRASATDPKAPLRVPFSLSLSLSAFPISAFAEAWEYDDDDVLDDDELEEMLSGGISAVSSERKSHKSSRSNVGVLERKANVTKIGGEVTIRNDAAGDVKVTATTQTSCFVILTDS